ncbi:gamma-secretase subunit pen-2-like [Teleopsis dalmanni]|uniref:gamma-secretase subunit pen-2-like n=1 Tax=Teleopsis dalmanni TaxID=139649 RepID=UPI0018CDD84E|nr:gamma-secretase subunit pen-2-like [Teleopsis dalmanni]XP_037952972.1 gamma-secretase subunit pen-2 [Teleopsis dalmanni]XP_037952998.1 gamma-secretase subunit pen-2-like [Teleopsis dalmanni]
MDISKVNNQKKLELCRAYFRAGFALLPFVWAINAYWFFAEAFRKPPFLEQQQIKKYVIYSAFGTFLWLIALSIWVTIFQIKRAEWGAYGDYISFIIPQGRA